MEKFETPGQSLRRALAANHRYLISLVEAEVIANPECRVLDYGSGYGQVVFALREMGIEAYGVETFYGGEEHQQLAAVRDRDPDSQVVLLIQKGRLPFPDNYFDLVLSNQVFEHVADLGQALEELERVTKPSGKMVSLFPSRDVLIEWHLRLPLVHWIPRRSRLRRWLTWALRSVGFGAEFWGGSFDEWFLNAFRFLDNDVFYRKYSEVLEDYDPFFTVSHIEDQWLEFRIPRTRPLFHIPGFRRFARLLVREIGGMVILSHPRKPQAGMDPHQRRTLENGRRRRLASGRLSRTNRMMMVPAHLEAPVRNLAHRGGATYGQEGIGRHQWLRLTATERS